MLSSETFCGSHKAMMDLVDLNCIKFSVAGDFRVIGLSSRCQNWSKLRVLALQVCKKYISACRLYLFVLRFLLQCGYAFQERASYAEEEMIRGRTKLRFVFVDYQGVGGSILQSSHFLCYKSYDRQAGNQIRKAVLSTYKIEKQARGMEW